jgi:hypothetical protein
MSPEKSGYLILGITNKGAKFRPSDWIERIASTFGCFDSSQRLQYHPLVAPVVINKQAGLLVDDRMIETDKAGYDFIMAFAHSNHLQIIPLNQPDMPTSPIEWQKVA